MSELLPPMQLYVTHAIFVAVTSMMATIVREANGRVGSVFVAFVCGLGLFLSSANLLYVLLRTSYEAYQSDYTRSEVDLGGMILHVISLLILNLYAAWISISLRTGTRRDWGPLRGAQ